MEYDLKLQDDSLAESVEAAIALADFGELRRRLEKVVEKDVGEEVEREEGRKKGGRKEGGRKEEGGLVESAMVEAEENVEAEVGEEDEDDQKVGKEEDEMYGQNAWLVLHCFVQCLLAEW